MAKSSLLGYNRNQPGNRVGKGDRGGKGVQQRSPPGPLSNTIPPMQVAYVANYADGLALASYTATKIPFMCSQKKELRALRPNFHIHVSVSDLYIPTIDLPILLQENMWTDPGNLYIAHRHMNVEIGTEDA